jgi:hypothetical protein
MCRNIFLVLTVIGCGVLIPINLSQGIEFAGQNTLSKVTPISTFDRANYGMTVCAWLFNATVAGFLWWNYRAVSRLRRQYYDSPEYKASLHARTLMVCSMDIVLEIDWLMVIDQRHPQRLSIRRGHWQID